MGSNVNKTGWHTCSEPKLLTLLTGTSFKEEVFLFSVLLIMYFLFKCKKFFSNCSLKQTFVHNVTSVLSCFKQIMYLLTPS